MQPQLETLGVDQSVVPGTEQHEIGQVGRSTLGPEPHVVGVQCAVPGAAVEAAAVSVECADELTQRLGGQPLGAAQIVAGEVGGGERPQTSPVGQCGRQCSQ